MLFGVLNMVLRVHFLNWYGHKNSPIKRFKMKKFSHKKTIPHTTMEKSLYKWWVRLNEVLHGNFYSRTFWNHEKCSTTCGTICLTFLHTTNRYVLNYFSTLTKKKHQGNDFFLLKSEEYGVSFSIFIKKRAKTHTKHK